MTTITLPPDTLATHREQLAAWVQANGITPDAVPLHHPLRVEGVEGDTVIHYRVFVRTADGHIQTDPSNPTEVWTEQHTTPCTTPLPVLAPSMPGLSEQRTHAATRCAPSARS